MNKWAGTNQYFYKIFAGAFMGIDGASSGGVISMLYNGFDQDVSQRFGAASCKRVGFVGRSWKREAIHISRVCCEVSEGELMGK